LEDIEGSNVVTVAGSFRNKKGKIHRNQEDQKKAEDATRTQAPWGQRKRGGRERIRQGTLWTPGKKKKKGVVSEGPEL